MAQKPIKYGHRAQKPSNVSPQSPESLRVEDFVLQNHLVWRRPGIWDLSVFPSSKSTRTRLF